VRASSLHFFCSSVVIQERLYALNFRSNRQAEVSIAQRRRREEKLAQSKASACEAAGLGKLKKATEPQRGGTKSADEPPRFQNRFPGALAFCAIFLILTAVTTQAQSATQQPAPPNPTFTDRDASSLLRQLSEALEARSQKKLLALFDFSQMKDAEIFRQQLNSLIDRTDSIRVHLNLVETSAGPPGMTVDAEMETQTGDLNPASHKTERLSFTVARSGKTWKFIDLRPRSFFALP
jgi:hypothetical protein